jgi:hypothetical protein
MSSLVGVQSCISLPNAIEISNCNVEYNTISAVQLFKIYNNLKCETN